LPLICGLVRFEAGPVAVCFLAETVLPGDQVRVWQDANELLEAG
jgi:hypothetical protein